jgi:hypothetical protein
MPDSSSKTRLKAMTAWADEPALSDQEIDDLLTLYQVKDSAGIAPGEDDYTATYNLRGAAREGWKIKMGRAAKMASTDLDGNRASAQQIFDHCDEMVKRYAGAGTVSIGAA